MKLPIKTPMAFLLGAAAGAIGLAAIEGVIVFWWLGQ